jgi:hypothetical protein
VSPVLVIARPDLPAGVVAVPVRTALVKPGDDLLAIVCDAVRGIARPGDVIALSETALAIAQGQAVAAHAVRPSKLAYFLCRRAGALATVNQPESLQIVIDQVGAAKVLYAALMQAAGSAVGRRGLFYEILGEAITAIDGYTGTMPPFERWIVLAPHDPASFAQSVFERIGVACAVVDANDLQRAKVLGASQGVQTNVVQRALLSNPHGNSDEQTPIVVLKWRGAGENPLCAG